MKELLVIDNIKRNTEIEQHNITFKTYLLSMLEFNPLPKDDLFTISLIAAC